MIGSRQIVWGYARKFLDVGRVGIRRFLGAASLIFRQPTPIFFGILFILGLGGMIYKSYLSVTVPIPVQGGQYIEGIVGNRSQFSDIITRLTFAGLVAIDAQRSIIPVLANEWTISPDGKTYTFALERGIDSSEVAKTLKEEALFKTVEFQTPDPQTLVAKLKQPFGPFLSLLALPLLPYGPFLVHEEGDDFIAFAPNPAFPHRPYLDRIVVRIYPDDRSLKQAIIRREVMGAVQHTLIKTWQRFEVELPRSIMLLINSDRQFLSDAATRLRLLKGEPLPETISVRLVTTPQLKAYADETMAKWSKQNITVELIITEDATMRDQVIPKRDYDVLIYGMDFGIEPDPFRFWHSSQAAEGGLNLAQIKDGKLDAMLDEARKMVDDGQRFAKYAEIEKRIDELAVRLVLKKMTTTYQVDQKIKGVEPQYMINSAARYNLVWKWYTNERRELKKEG